MKSGFVILLVGILSALVFLGCEEDGDIVAETGATITAYMLWKDTYRGMD